MPVEVCKSDMISLPYHSHWHCPSRWPGATVVNGVIGPCVTLPAFAD
jgi:hypothetical protein